MKVSKQEKALARKRKLEATPDMISKKEFKSVSMRTQRFHYHSMHKPGEFYGAVECVYTRTFPDASEMRTTVTLLVDKDGNPVLQRQYGTCTALSHCHHLSAASKKIKLFEMSTILGEVYLGLSARKIADKLFRSKKTIEYHIDRIKKKLQCNTRGDMIAIAIKSGLTYTIFNTLIEGDREY